MKKHIQFLPFVKTMGFAFLINLFCTTPLLATDSRANPDVTTSQQQSKLITGTVTDESGEPILGANIIVVGTATGIISDMDGKFQLNVAEGADIRVSYIGFLPQTIKIGSRNSYAIVLREDAEKLDEVVVVGYGTMKKSDISGSVVSVNQEEMMKRNPINIAQGLQGAAAGVLVTRTSGDPSGEATIRIRGVATVNGSADPLYVVDGVQVGSSIDFINPADVESIEILKDASATAIYGAQGANGVILVTTKRGEKGKTNVNFSANFGIQNMQGSLDVADAELFAYSVRQGRANDGAIITNKAFGEEYTGKLRSIDWQDVMTQTAFRQNYMLSVSGGTEKTQSTFSVGYLDNEGIVLDTKYSRLTARASTVYKVKDFIEVGGNLSFQHNERNITGNLRNYAILTPTMDYVDELTGEFISHNYNDRAVDGKYYGFMQTSGEGDIQKGQDNPYAARKEADKTPGYSNNLLASAYLDLKLFKGLSFRTVGSYRFNSYDGSEFRTVNYRVPSSSSVNSFNMNQNQRNVVALESYFTYNWSNDIHNLTLMAGNTVSNNWRHSVNASANNFLSDTYRDISLTSDQASRNGGGSYSLKTRYVSYYGRAMYSLMDRYILTGTVRRDGSSNFGSGNRWGVFPSAALAWRLSEEDFIKNLDIFSNLKLRVGWGQTGNAGEATNLSVAQLSSNRVAYDWGSLNGYTGDYTMVPGIAQLREIDTNLKWETNTQTNVGLDIGLLNNSLNITLDYFIRDSKDLLLYRSMRPSTGYSEVYTNAGHIKNKGFEFNIAYNKRFGDWTFGASLSGSTLKNEAIEVGDPIYYRDSDDGDNWDQHSITMNGYAVGSYYGYVVEGIFQSQAEVDAMNQKASDATGGEIKVYQLQATTAGDYKYKDLNGDGYIDGEDREVLGNGFPTLNYGLTLTAGYKNFDAMVYLYGVAGMDIYSYASMKMTQLYKTTGGIQNTLKEYINKAWTPQNTNTDYSRLTIVDRNLNQRASDAYIKSGDFLKIANIQIGYTLPKSVLLPLKMENARLFASVENPFCFSSYSKFGDPEVGNIVDNKPDVLFTGFDKGRYPYPRTFTFGLSVQF
ncbi:TonB-linked SusC/RagA family outer membrane protein [Parabacteroides sp. PF5-5]|uniref:SusC/RagA family TonB-linked outer membrane protein n=1 Tax=unclassified Parabacteroides TaxID=2649774 RepID=UPI00247461EF|nr:MULTISPECIES: TonB-dependent receptor [unclassified Parabacteroides]MDH6303422.1 TonB-linked SusC/RagA family outer membrane protein [Parabacteroides sp. PH5-39]MDH6314745.1 TonB-linked SusC/RagA family outer membrane protein [Parabacteroides sp. PF5-13]MDH6318082.1 TonB-linked SusC/RagA family outer membrane protein [Parabacteroides sp. PH5-13]MDH6321987.1 TonB-linked SusC/RagA family outer membrane protein [Parabacteroides sp. PH5-8]MDH6326110.1 TonB-linked SusC/RagA family outer membrane